MDRVGEGSRGRRVWVALQYEMRCRAANGNAFRQGYMFVFELRDVGIAATWDYYDTLALERVMLPPGCGR